MVQSLAHRLRLVHSKDQSSLCSIPAARLPELSFAQAAEWREVRGAFRLLYDNYRAKGLVPPNPLGLRYTPFNLLPDSATFIVEADRRAVATVSLIVDSEPFGLPMDNLYSTELDPLRQAGRKIAEISGLAVHESYQAHSLTLVMHLVKLFFTYARKLEVTDLVIACHPRHSRLYKRLFLFQDLGGYRSYGPLNDAPAVAVRLGVEEAEGLYRDAYDADGFNLHTFFFTNEVFRCPAAALRTQAFTHEACRELVRLQPSIERVLEEGRPGLVKRLTGEEAASKSPLAAGGWLGSAWDLQPAFVAA